jgi:hypothetical protein
MELEEQSTNTGLSRTHQNKANQTSYLLLQSINEALNTAAAWQDAGVGRGLRFYLPAHLLP